MKFGLIGVDSCTKILLSSAIIIQKLCVLFQIKSSLLISDLDQYIFKKYKNWYLNMTTKILLITFLIIFTISLASAQELGNATYYSNNLKGHYTSNADKYHPDSFTCAHRTYAFGTILKVRNHKNNKQVIVKVNDRGPRQKRLIIDLSYSAAKQLEIIQQGSAKIEITKLDNYSKLIDLIPLDSIYKIKNNTAHFIFFD